MKKISPSIETLMKVLAGETRGSLSKTQLSAFMQSVTHDHENLAFFDAVVLFCYKFEYWQDWLAPEDEKPKKMTDVSVSRGRQKKKLLKSPLLKIMNGQQMGAIIVAGSAAVVAVMEEASSLVVEPLLPIT